MQKPEDALLTILPIPLLEEPPAYEEQNPLISKKEELTTITLNLEDDQETQNVEVKTIVIDNDHDATVTTPQTNLVTTTQDSEKIEIAPSTTIAADEASNIPITTCIPVTVLKSTQQETVKQEKEKEEEAVASKPKKIPMKKKSGKTVSRILLPTSINVGG